MLHRFELEIDGRMLALERVISLVRRRAFAIRWLEFDSRKHGARISFVIEADEDAAHWLESNLWKLHEVQDVRQAAEYATASCDHSAWQGGF